MAFIFTRETHSIEHLKKAGIEGEHVGFAPDATFFLNIHDNKKAEIYSDRVNRMKAYIY